MLTLSLSSNYRFLHPQVRIRKRPCLPKEKNSRMERMRTALNSKRPVICFTVPPGWPHHQMRADQQMN
jgi:hypothetical protein